MRVVRGTWPLATMRGGSAGTLREGWRRAGAGRLVLVGSVSMHTTQPRTHVTPSHVPSRVAVGFQRAHPRGLKIGPQSVRCLATTPPTHRRVMWRHTHSSSHDATPVGRHTLTPWWWHAREASSRRSLSRQSMHVGPVVPHETLAAKLTPCRPQEAFGGTIARG